ncbi:MAG: hypothetical protein ACREQ5_04100 [Candidatus Dormibacteria bacterium]
MAAFYGVSSPLDLTYAIAGQGEFQLLANGTGLTASSVLEWNGSPLPTTFGDSTDLAATVSSTLIAQPGTATITISDSGATSNAVPFGIASSASATAGVVSLVTAAPNGSPANGDSLVAPSISATGRYVAFQSNATNLAPGPASGFQEIYERDTCIGAPSGCTPNTIRITVTNDGSPVNGHSRSSAVSADGRYVAFDSSATNILPNSGICGQQPGSACVFLRDTCIGAVAVCAPATFAVSLDTQDKIALGSGPQMSPDSRFVSFVSSSSVLGLGNATVGDVFIRDTCISITAGCTPTTTLVSIPSDGSQGNQTSQLQAISSTARFVAFLSFATNMIPNETVTPGIFWRDTCLGITSNCTPATIRVDITMSGVQPNQGAFFGPFTQISGDGRLIAFTSQATNFVSANVRGWGNLYVRDTCAGAPTGCSPTTTLVSLTNDGSVGNAPSPSQGLSMTPNGRFIAFDSIATNLVPGDTFAAGSFEDVFVRDTCFGAPAGCVSSTVRVSVTDIPNIGTEANTTSGYPAISADGHYLVFLSAATNLVTPSSNGHAMVYLVKTGF